MSPAHSRHSAPALSDDDMVSIFLRIPPDEPAHLVRASLACKAWRRILASPDFCRLYREFHRTPPMLGFVLRFCAPESSHYNRFIPTTAFRPSPDLNYLPQHWKFVDSHHGSILVKLLDDSGFIVWDPITNSQLGVPSPTTGIRVDSWAAAVLCAKENCDHLGCHGQPFLVAMVFCSFGTTSGCVYSSESGVWSDIITLGLGYRDQLYSARASVLARNALHVLFFRSVNVLQYKFREQKLSLIELPGKDWNEEDVPSWFISAEDDELVFAGMDYRGTRLSLWSTKAGALAWEKRTVIDLQKLLPPRAFMSGPHSGWYKHDICGFAEGIVFLNTMAGLFMLELNSGRTKKVAEAQLEKTHIVLPWKRFYTPEEFWSCISNDQVSMEKSGLFWGYVGKFQRIGTSFLVSLLLLEDQ